MRVSDWSSDVCSSDLRVADARINIEMCRLLTLKAAWMMDTAGNKTARQEIAMIKVAAPNMALQVIDDAMQAHGGGAMRSEERRVGKAGVSTCRSRRSPHH